MLIAFLLALAGAACTYLSSSHQRWLKRALPSLPGRLCAGLLLTCSLVWLWLSMRSLAAYFLFASWLMLVLVVFPYLGAALQLWRSRKSHE